ncbi:MAG: DUF1304 domain-containing protein [Pseudomonadota bacterium]
MALLPRFLIFVVALLHIYFMLLEMVFWQQPLGLKTFSMTPEEAALMAPLAFNQGLYNGFLASGLIWGLLSKRLDVVIFFLLCVSMAGIVGGLTVKFSIFFIQSLPALGALFSLWILKPKD